MDNKELVNKLVQFGFEKTKESTDPSLPYFQYVQLEGRGQTLSVYGEFVLLNGTIFRGSHEYLVRVILNLIDSARGMESARDTFNDLIGEGVPKDEALVYVASISAIPLKELEIHLL